ncbi:hypothetical protein PR048_009898 [Dryococelus australis]|uniref:Uncharacterized protein n=1 Tax=Dryococelus australis TaxID=614101 RepID=A0ABQ9I153_9NEOP|nr:hypothetical protein PR048_009898 [Dryococelus australis]
MPIITIRVRSQKTSDARRQYFLRKRAKDTKLKFTNDTVRAFVSENIPLVKHDHPAIREWLNEYIKGSGDLPNATTLHSLYMNILKMEEESKIKEAVKDQAIVLFRILLASGEHKMLVAGAKYLNNANSTKCSTAVVDILLKYEVKY